MTTNGDAPDGRGGEDIEASVEAPPAAEPSPVAVLEAEKADLKDRLMRALAETENLRRRSERDSADARAYAVTNFARDMLTVADNIRRALESVPRTDGQVEEGARTLVEGIELTERDMLTTLGRHGVKALDPKGQKFDPNMHQAMFEVPNDAVPNGTVLEVIQGGWAIGERVLRPALVGVSKGGAKVPAPEPAVGGASSE